MEKNEKSVKIIILGDDKMENEKLRERYIKDEAQTNKGEKRGIMISKMIQNIKYKLTLLEFSDKDCINEIQNSQAVFIQFDPRDRASFTNLYDNWILHIRDDCKYEGMIAILGNYLDKQHSDSDIVSEDEIYKMIKISEVTAKYVKIAELNDDELKEKFDELMKDADEHDMRREKNNEQNDISLKSCRFF